VTSVRPPVHAARRAPWASVRSSCTA
jgi:hypothetical protein